MVGRGLVWSRCLVFDGAHLAPPCRLTDIAVATIATRQICETAGAGFVEWPRGDPCRRRSYGLVGVGQHRAFRRREGPHLGHASVQVPAVARWSTCVRMCTSFGSRRSPTLSASTASKSRWRRQPSTQPTMRSAAVSATAGERARSHRLARRASIIKTGKPTARPVVGRPASSRETSLAICSADQLVAEQSAGLAVEFGPPGQRCRCGTTVVGDDARRSTWSIGAYAYILALQRPGDDLQITSRCMWRAGAGKPAPTQRHVPPRRLARSTTLPRSCGGCPAWSDPTAKKS